MAGRVTASLITVTDLCVLITASWEIVLGGCVSFIIIFNPIKGSVDSMSMWLV